MSNPNHFVYSPRADTEFNASKGKGRPNDDQTGIRCRKCKRPKRAQLVRSSTQITFCYSQMVCPIHGVDS